MTKEYRSEVFVASSSSVPPPPSYSPLPRKGEELSPERRFLQVLLNLKKKKNRQPSNPTRGDDEIYSEEKGKNF
jgi:hypothetical protein